MEDALILLFTIFCFNKSKFKLGKALVKANLALSKL